MLEPIFIAANISEIDAAEKLLDREGVAYSVRTDHALHESGGVCLMGMLFEVAAVDASRCRELLIDHGLARGVVTMECN